MNISDMTNKSQGGYAYTMIDVDSNIPKTVTNDLLGIKGVLRVRVLN